MITLLKRHVSIYTIDGTYRAVRNIRVVTEKDSSGTVLFKGRKHLVFAAGEPLKPATRWVSTLEMLKGQDYAKSGNI